MREIELKFALDPADEAAFRGARALAGAPHGTKRHLAIYFDTPSSELSGEGMALRLRREGRRWVQALKAGHSGTGGLHERQEWEYGCGGPELDLARFAATPLAKLPDPARLHERLGEVFRVDLRRTSWIVEPVPGARVEVVLDRGAVEAKGRALPLCEVEIESKAGDAGEIFALARRLLEEVALRPSAVSKAQRGYRLASGARLHPSKARSPQLERDATAGSAARAIVGLALAQFQANEEGLLQASDPEFVHQARVALRRLRSALRIFRDPIGRERAQAWREALGKSAGALGGARDWDVFGTETLPAVLTAFGDAALARSLKARAARRRRVEREAARAALRSREHARALLEVTAWLAQDDAAGESVALADFAARVIRKRHKRLAADAAGFGSLTAVERHRLRIDVKRLRYGVDAVASLFPARRVERYLDVLVALQDSLGHANDAVTAARLLPELAPPEAFATFARGWFAGQAVGDPAIFETLVGALVATPRFWRRKAAGDQAES